MFIEVLVPGSCGEIARGWKDGQPFMISCPIGLYSRVIVTDRTSAKTGFQKKAELALKITTSYMGFESFPLGMALESQLPTGKGMAASTADIVAVIQGVATAIEEELDPEEVAELAAGIEPTDGIFYPGIANMNYMTGALNKTYEDVPKMIIAMFDFGGKVNSIELFSDYHGHEDSPAELMEAITALDSGLTPEKIARVSTLSALENQKILEKPQLEEIIEYVKSLGALGVNVAHSGTMMGVLFAPDFSMIKVNEAVKAISAKFPHLEYFETERMISGGCSVKQRSGSGL